ncbi:hypothetical protein V3851_08935 [Paenibacillus sp. M1]|uniref:DUF2642 domain-containing protein n=1 Tax=Paenibacillus haidiansis TaxID=1574488 RepID=A0ABU7VRE9_9BACL
MNRISWEKDHLPDCDKPVAKRVAHSKKSGSLAKKFKILRHNLTRKFIRLKLQIIKLNRLLAELTARVNLLQNQVETINARVGSAPTVPPPKPVPPGAAPGSTPPGPPPGLVLPGPPPGLVPPGPPPGPSVKHPVQSTQQNVTHEQPSNNGTTVRGGAPQESVEAVNARVSALHQLVDSQLVRMNSQQQQLNEAFANIIALRQLVEQIQQGYVGGPSEEYQGLISALTPRLNTVVTIDTPAGPINGTLVAIGEDYVEILEPDGSTVLIPFEEILSVS